MAHQVVPCVWRPPPMTDPASQIRLLWIHAGEKDEEIRCTVSIWNLKDAPEFRAISYTWGSPGLKASVSVTAITPSSGRNALDLVVEVRENARYALWQARLHHPDSYIWIDSLCINQTDLQEKSAQVAMMAKIYASALAVLACIGPGDDSSDFIREASRIDCALVPQFEGELRIAVTDRQERLRSLLGAEVMKQLLACWNRFSRREYFSRLWIIQELHSSRPRFVLCGEYFMSWEDIVELQRRLYGWGFDDYVHSDKDHCDTIISNLDDLLHIGDRAYSSSGLNGIWGLLAQFLCEDVRDRIYGVLGLIDWEQAEVPMPVPDYESPVFELTVRLVPQARNQRLQASSGQTKLLGLELLPTPILIDQFKASQYLKQSAAVDPPMWVFKPYNVCFVQQDCHGRLCADLVLMEDGEWESAFEAGRLLKAAAQLNGRDAIALPFSDGEDPVRIYTGDTVSVIVWPEVEPGDILVQINRHCFVTRQLVDETKFRVVGHAFLLNQFTFRHQRSWTCGCWPSEEQKMGPTKFLTLSFPKLNNAEAMMLATRSSDGHMMNSRLERCLLNVPPIGSLVEDHSSTELQDADIWVQTIEESCTEHNAEECNRWRRNLLQFAAASGCGRLLYTVTFP
ncbi:hypothetical protein BST61_g9475 [Cercospora zeina]